MWADGFLRQQDGPDLEPILHRRHNYKITPDIRRKMGRYESQDFQPIDNIITREYEHKKTKLQGLERAFGRWMVCLAIGLVVGAIGYGVKEAVQNLFDAKFDTAQDYLDDGSIPRAFFLYFGLNAAAALLASVMVVFVEEQVGASGLPEVKGFLNGVRLPKTFNIKTLLGKIAGLILSFSSSLALGPEGPMIHIGAAVGAGLSQLRSRTLNLDLKAIHAFNAFRNDIDRRDFISCGAAAGVAAAFSAPIGGVLYSIEEASSFWNNKLTWRTFFCCMISTFTVNLMLSGFSASAYIHYKAFLSFGITPTSKLYRYAELIPFMLIGVAGGIMGALFVYLNIALNKWRHRFFKNRKMWRMGEVFLLVTITSLLFFFLPYAYSCSSDVDLPPLNPCRTYDVDDHLVTRQNCDKNTYNQLASLTFTSPEYALQRLFRPNSSGLFSNGVLFVFGGLYFVLSVLTSGLALPAGLFIPMMTIGASWGRLVGELVRDWLDVDAEVSIYAVIGCCAMITGFSRLTITICAIIVELTQETQYLLPVIISVMCAKWVGDLFNESLYEHSLEMKYVPYLYKQPPKSMLDKTIQDVMVSNVKYLHMVESVHAILNLLHSTSHNGFPVVEKVTMVQDLGGDASDSESENDTKIKLRSIHHDYQFDSKTRYLYRGFILRSQLLVLLKKKVFSRSASGTHDALEQDQFYAQLARQLTFDEVVQNLTEHDRHMFIDLKKYMNISAPVIHDSYSATRAYDLFVTMGYRHMTVINKWNEVVGIVSRKDFF